jgi:hypothetical protein
VPYFIGFKLTRSTSKIYVESFKSLEKAKKQYDHLKETEEPGEIITPPFFADSEDEAREKAKKLIPD